MVLIFIDAFFPSNVQALNHTLVSYVSAYRMVKGPRHICPDGEHAEEKTLRCSKRLAVGMTMRVNMSIIYFFFSLFALRFSFKLDWAFFRSCFLPLSFFPLSPMSISPCLKVICTLQYALQIERSDPKFHEKSEPKYQYFTEQNTYYIHITVVMSVNSSITNTADFNQFCRFSLSNSCGQSSASGRLPKKAPGEFLGRSDEMMSEGSIELISK